MKALAREISEQLRTLKALAEPDTMQYRAMDRLATALLALQGKSEDEQVQTLDRVEVPL